jgi:ABC-type uncharacterized transport system ATPase subunit
VTMTLRQFAAVRPPTPLLKPACVFGRGGDAGSQEAVRSVLGQAGLEGEGAEQLAAMLSGKTQVSAFDVLAKEKPRAAQTFADTTSYLNAIQEGVGGKDETGQKQVTELQAIKMLLTQLNQKDFGGGAVFSVIVAALFAATWSTFFG